VTCIVVHSGPEKNTGNMTFSYATVFEHFDEEYERKKRADVL
jgi:hypothetical protein